MTSRCHTQWKGFRRPRRYVDKSMAGLITTALLPSPRITSGERSAVASVRHGIDDVVDADADSERRELFVIVRIVGPFPGIADVGVERHRHHQPAAIVVNPAPARRTAFALIRHAGGQVAGAGHLPA